MPDKSDSTNSNLHSVALIVPNASRRRTLVAELAGIEVTIGREFTAYPLRAETPNFAQLEGCDVAIVDLDDNVEQALAVIQTICSRETAMTVMAYSSRNDSTLMRRSMQAGAREFLIEPLDPEAVREAFLRTSSRRSSKEKSPGKVFVFVPSKGGVGLTTITTNFALALTKESGAKVVVVDLDFQLGEIALGLGMIANFSVVDALLNVVRLDREFLATLLLRHSSGLAVLSSPEDYNFFHSPVDEGAAKLFKILREEFDYVVVDTGTCHGNIQEALFGMADKLYLVTEMTFPALRNGHRLVAFLGARDWSRHLEVILNRYNSRHADIDEPSATKALGRPINWKIPNGYAAARAAEDSGVPLAMGDCPITRVLVQMAREACGKALTPEKKPNKGFSFFGARALPEQVNT